MTRCAKVYLYGYFGFGNVGDDLLLQAVLGFLDRRLPRARFLVRTLAPVASVRAEGEVVFQCAEGLLSDPTVPKPRRLLRYLVKQWNDLAGCTHFVFSGGTLFHARGGALTNLLLIFSLVVMARLRGASVCAVGVGVGPLPSAAARRLFAAVVRLCAIFVVRDTSSFANCPEPVRARIARAADLVFALPLAPAGRATERRVGVTLAASDIGAELVRYPWFAAQFRRAMEALQAAGWSISFLSFQELNAGTVALSDSRLFADLAGGIEDVDHVRVSSDVDVMQAQFARCSVIVGMRFHALVLAALQGIPCVGFGRDHKLSDLCAALAMPFLSLDDFSAEALLTGVAAQALPEAARVTLLRSAALENFRLLENAVVQS